MHTINFALFSVKRIKLSRSKVITLLANTRCIDSIPAVQATDDICPYPRRAAR